MASAHKRLWQEANIDDNQVADSQQECHHQLEVASQLNNFATSLLQVVGKTGSGDCSKDVLISPFSLAAVLSMTHVGAKGDTALQLQQALGLTKVPDEEERNAAVANLIKSVKGDGDIVLKTANLLYISEKHELKEEFESNLKKYFEASAESVDFKNDATRTKINKFMKEFTESKITNLFPEGSLKKDTEMLLCNAVYFKGDWPTPFNKTLLTKTFYLGSEERPVNVRMMRTTRKFLTGNIDALDAQFVELPYKGLKMSMIVILPNEIDGLAKVEANLSGSVLDEMDKIAKRKSVTVTIPKFRIETCVNLKDNLAEMGVKDLFLIDDADLTGISDRELYVTDVVQKCFIEIDEKGTVVTAVTGYTGKWTGGASPTHIPFTVDHPAVFFLRNNATKLVLFIGRLADPPQVPPNLKESLELRRLKQ